MGWLSAIGRTLFALDGDPIAPRNWDDPRWWGLPILQSIAGQTVTSDSALQLSVVQSVLERLGGTVSSLPLMVFERDGDDKTPARDHPLFKLLHTQPNLRSTAQEFRDEQQRHLAWWRNCYARILPAADGGPVGGLEAIHPQRVQKVWRAPDGWVYYQVRRLDPSGQSDVLREDEIWHIRKAPLTDDGLQGKPVWQSARETFGRAQAVEQFASLFFANGGRGGGVLEHPGAFKSKEDELLFLKTWRETRGGLNAHKDALLLFGVKYNELKVQNDEAQFIETKKEMAVDLCRLWNMPPHLVGILDKATFSNIEQQSIEYVIHTLAPWITAWEQAASRDLLVGADQDRYFVEFNVAGLLRGDFKTRWQGYQWGRLGGWMSVNDIRRLENMEPIGPAGDIYLQPLNSVPAGSADPEEAAEVQNDPQTPEQDQEMAP